MYLDFIARKLIFLYELKLLIRKKLRNHGVSKKLWKFTNQQEALRPLCSPLIAINKRAKIWTLLFSPFRKGRGHLFKQFKFRLPTNVLCQIWLILAQLFWRKITLNVFNLFLVLSYNLSLKKKAVKLNLNKLKSPFLKNALFIGGN